MTATPFFSGVPKRRLSHPSTWPLHASTMRPPHHRDRTLIQVHVHWTETSVLPHVFVQQTCIWLRASDLRAPPRETCGLHPGKEAPPKHDRDATAGVARKSGAGPAIADPAPRRTCAGRPGSPGAPAKRRAAENPRPGADTAKSIDLEVDHLAHQALGC